MVSNALGRALARLGASKPVAPPRALPEGITIAIPNWNHEYVLPRSVGSALATVKTLRATGIAAEVIVIDDASRDGSLTLLRQMEALYWRDGLRVYARTQNGGLPVARNWALHHATYRRVVFMDADNELLPDNIPLFYRAMRETNAAVVYGNLLWRGQRDDQNAIMSNESFQARIHEENYIDAFALVDRVQVLDVGGYTNNLAIEGREDWELFLHLAANGRKIIFVPVIFGIYHDLADSMIKDDGATHQAQKGYVRRVFNQLGVRASLPLNTRHLRYHPDIGYL